jgi:hypothetical protein
VAAPSCCGKTHFLKQLQSGRLKHLESAMGFSAPIDSYISVIPRQLGPYRDTAVSRMILHFAIPTIALNDGSLSDLGDEPRLQIVRKAERVTVITLLASAGTLASRLKSRYRENRKMIVYNFSSYLSERRRMNRLKEMYADPTRITVAYEAWFRHVQTLANLRHECLVTAEAGYEVFESGEWPRISDEYFPVSPSNS